MGRLIRRFVFSILLRTFVFAAVMFTICYLFGLTEFDSPLNFLEQYSYMALDGIGYIKTLIETRDELITSIYAGTVMYDVWEFIKFVCNSVN